MKKSLKANTNAAVIWIVMKKVRKTGAFLVICGVASMLVTPTYAGTRLSTGSPPPPVSTTIKPAVSGL